MRLNNSPWGNLYLKALQLLFKVHPYGHPIIGYVKDIKKLHKTTG